MHHDRVALGQLQARGRHLIARNVILQANLLSFQPLLLHAQQHDHVCSAQRVFNVPGHSQAGRECGGDVGHKLRRTAKRQLDSEAGEQMAGTAGDAAVKNVSDDRGLQSFERFLVLENRERVEQSLGGMFMHAVAGIDHGDVEMRSHQVRSAC
jgi:hypothetical protein